MQEIYKQRIKRVKNKLSQSQRASAVLLSSSPSVSRSRDTNYPYHRDSDFFYLTGIQIKGFSILISNNLSRPYLFAEQPREEKIIWEGPPPSFKKIAENLNAELVISSSPGIEIKKYLKGVEVLYFQNIHGSVSLDLTLELLKTPSHKRFDYPITFNHSDLILEEMRLYKDPSEVKLISEAVKITFDSLRSVLPLICRKTKESEIAATLEYGFRIRGAEVGFASIVGSGRSAATLHYIGGERALKNGELLLIDCGAEYQNYLGDITRIFPVNGKFNSLQRELYNIVLDAKNSAIARIKDGVRIRTVYSAAARVLTSGLVDLGILRGKISALMKKQAYREYFPHGIGHSLGLDAHDIGRLRNNNLAVLKKGMVFTVEPGLYFAKKTGKVPACGLRLEDDILVTKNGCKNLCSFIPETVEDVEELMRF
jgi:Xaa-Pro aminopeptidase